MARVNLDQVKKEISRQDGLRENLIRDARKLIIKSKTAIGCIQRDEMEQGAKVLEQMKQELAELGLTAAKHNKLLHEGIFKVAAQEYVEALSLYYFVKEGKILPYSEEFHDPENYLMGLCDLSGELVRKAINAVIKDDPMMAVRIRHFLEDMYTEMSKFDFKNGELRRKYDGIKYDVKKLDDVVFQLKMKDKV
ncbi:MAG: hypothetical protein Q7S65_03575 [Nanoarchaeota archaeon]|nr:hypothetical protein [Nanoarchaeota archaeon]